ncbi:MAG: galactokinase [Chloroflexi bacterium]|nr:galactokinase [Chloroflexota bacterium]
MVELIEIYGSDLVHSHRQEERYEQALALFSEAFGSGPVDVFRVPGRVNLIGEHTDYSQGYVLPVALDRDVLFIARPRTDGTIRLANAEAAFPPESFVLSDAISPAVHGHWSNYVRGASQMMAQRLGATRGMDVLVDGRAPWGIPRGAGLSSSSALTVAAAVALEHVNGLAVDRQVLAEACGYAEWYVGTRGGIMDQFAALLSHQGHALFLDCRPEAGTGRYHTQAVPLPPEYAIVVVNSGVRHRNTSPLFNTRVAEVRSAVALVQQRFPQVRSLRDLEGIPWESYVDLLPEEQSPDDLAQRGISLATLMNGGIMPDSVNLQVRARCRHVTGENARVLAAVEALAQGDVERLAKLMREAHASARDNFDISTPELESLVRLAEEIPGVKGARLTGAGWGGCIVALVPVTSVETFVSRVPQGYQRATGLRAEAFVCSAGHGASRVTEYTRS